MGLLNTSAVYQKELEKLYEDLYSQAPQYQVMPPTATSSAITSTGSQMTLEAMKQYINDAMGMPDIGMTEAIKESESPVLEQLLEELI